MTCVFVGRLPGAKAACYGRLQTHHVIPRQQLKARWQTMMRNNESPPPLKTWLNDERNLLKVCMGHHQLVEGRRIYVDRDMLPDGAEGFAGEVGLWWYLDRYWPKRDDRHWEDGVCPENE